MACVNDLTDKQQKALYALLVASTRQQAAEQAGVSLRTLTRWLSEDSAFQQAYRDELAALGDSVRESLSGASVDSVAALRDVVKDGSASERIRAAAVLLGTWARLTERQHAQSIDALVAERMEALDMVVEHDGLILVNAEHPGSVGEGGTRHRHGCLQWAFRPNIPSKRPLCPSSATFY